MNPLLVAYIQHLYDRKATLRDARYAVLGVQMRYRALRGHLRVAWDSVASWQLGQRVAHRVPMPEAVMEAVFAVCLVMGFVADPVRARWWIPLAVVLRAAFFGLLRPIEAWALASHGVALPSARVAKLGPRLGALMVEKPKNRRAMGVRQFASVRDVVCLDWLQWLVRELPPGVRLFPGAMEAMRGLFQEALELLGLQGLGFGLGSFRAGGATALFAADVAVDRIRFQGRWAGARSLECYLQEAVCALVVANLEPAAAGLEAMIQLGEGLRSPPAAMWTQFFSRRAQLSALLRERLRVLEVEKARLSVLGGV